MIFNFTTLSHIQLQYLERKNKMKLLQILVISLLLSSGISCQSMKQYNNSIVLPIYEPSEETFEGPFDSWYDVKKDFGAIGDGMADDTKAIQSAFDALKLNKKRIIYLPEGIYNITATLTLSSLININILGADPLKTVIIWNGELGGTMLDCDGVSYSRYGRITWDGNNGRAKCAVNHGWDGKRPFANTFGEHTDEIFKNVAFGIRGGSKGFMDAECVLKRCRFYNCTKAGISLENFNAADWQIRYCTFISCYIGVTNKYGAGPFNVYNSYFSGSIYADICKYHCGFYALRHNISIHSNMFFMGENHSCPGLVTLQGNKIYETDNPTAIQIGDEGPSLILDNNVISKQSNINFPSIAVAKGETCTSIGNTFNIPNPYNVYRSDDSIYAIDDKIDKYEKNIIKQTSMPDFANKSTSFTYDVPKNAGDSVIQTFINNAFSSSYKNPVIHFSAGRYPIKNTIKIPPQKTITLIGDGRDTRFEWKNKSSGIMFELEGPNHSILKEFSLYGNSVADGIHVEKCDQINAQIILDQAASRVSNEAGFLSNQLDNTSIYLYNGYHNRAKNIAIKAIGGKRKNKGEKTNGKLCLFAGASSDNVNSYDVQKGADMLINDIWYETAKSDHFTTFSDSTKGNLTLCGFKVATDIKPFNHNYPDSTTAGIDIKGFHGNLSLLNLILFSRLIIHNTVSSDANILVSYTAKDSMLLNLNSKDNVDILGYSFFRKDGGANAIKLTNKPNKEFILKMLEQERNFIPQPIITKKKDITDVRMYRITVEEANVGFQFDH